MTINEIKRVFYGLVKDANIGMTLSLSQNRYIYVRFNYIENGIFFGEGYIDEEYEAQFSDGTVNYIPSLRVDDTENFFEYLYRSIRNFMIF